jgi:hypothetical protein
MVKEELSSQKKIMHSNQKDNIKLKVVVESFIGPILLLRDKERAMELSELS